MWIVIDNSTACFRGLPMHVHLLYSKQCSVRYKCLGDDDLGESRRCSYEEEDDGGRQEGTDSEQDREDTSSHLDIPLNWDQLSESSQVEGNFL
jgi:hypothetical protein